MSLQSWWNNLAWIKAIREYPQLRIEASCLAAQKQVLESEKRQLESQVANLQLENLELSRLSEERKNFLGQHRRAAQQTCVGNMKGYPPGSILLLRLTEAPDDYMSQLLNEAAKESGSVLLITYPGCPFIDASTLDDETLAKAGLTRKWEPEAGPDVPSKAMIEHYREVFANLAMGNWRELTEVNEWIQADVDTIVACIRESNDS